MKKYLLLSFCLLFAPHPTAAATINASVAASLTDAFTEIAASFTATHPEVEILPNYGASGALAKQVVQGAPADLFISANQQWLDYLLQSKAADPETVVILAANRLVFVGAKEGAASLNDLPGLKRIAIGSPKSVPAGQYAEEVLKRTGIYERLAADGKLVQTRDVRQALVYADRGEVDGAFVYKTDARLAQSAVILFEVPAERHAPIIYPMALTTTGAKKPEAVAFLAYLRSATARALLAKCGFAPE
jgi:molybdate transport system substrate-binding protein